MNTRRSFSHSVSSVVILVSLGLGTRARGAERPNMVVFLSDDHTLRDSSLYGATDIRTPNMERIAAAGMTFDRAFVASPSCAPSRAALLTGLMPARNGAEANHARPKREIRKLPAYLQELGYEVVAFGKVGHYAQTAEYGFDYCAHMGYHEDIAIPKALDWLSRRASDRPLCLFVGTNWPHVPWPKAERYRPRDVRVPPHHVATPRTRQARARYYEAVHQMDLELGQVYDLAREKLGEGTLFIHTSDHGAQWPFGKWTLYEDGIHTPLIISWPGKVAPGTRTGAMVSWVDLLPTLVAAAGGEPPGELDGRSILPVLLGEATAHRDRIFTTHSGDGDFNVYPSRSVRTERWKYILNLHPEYRFSSHITRLFEEPLYWPSWQEKAQRVETAARKVERYRARPEEELYDLGSDPYEQSNLASNPAQAERLASFRSELEAWMDAQGDERRVYGTPEPLSQKAECPNLLVIFIDDMGWGDLSCFGNTEAKTPNIDRIAAAGMRFDRCFAVNSICTPSRASILTGKYSHINGVPVFNRFDGSQTTVAKHLQKAGYHTGMIGKWHLGSDPTGFDYWIVLPGQGIYHDPAFLTPDGRTNFAGYVTDIITDLTLQFIEKRPKDRPFFVMCHHKAPHRNWQPDAKHATMYDDRDIPEPATLRDDYAGRADAARETTMTVARHLTRNDLKLTPPPDLKGPALQRWRSESPAEVTIEVDGQKKTLTDDDLLKWKYQKYIKDYLRCVASVDDNVGRLLDYLDKTGLASNTIVIYTSDQGFFLGDHGWYDKRFMYEESVKMPFLVRWPGVTPPGSTQSAIALNVDFAPTFMEMARLPSPGADMQGRSLASLLLGKTPADWRTSWYYRYYHDPGDHNTRAHYGVGTATNKLIYFWKNDQWELYDLVKDPAELHNVYGDPAYADTVASLKKELLRLKTDLRDEDQFADQPPPHEVDGPFNPPRAGQPKRTPAP